MKRGLAFLLLILSILFLGASISCFVDAAQGKDVSNSIGGGFVLLAFTLGSGIGALRGLGRRGAKPGLSQDETEHLVLTTASSSGGKLTVAELALESGLSIDEAQESLDGLAAKGVAEIEVTAAGVTLYSFHGLGDDSDKAASVPVSKA
ncbi:MAG: hypothetical protein ACOYM2_05420 [Rectinemataceae bacterium]